MNDNVWINLKVLSQLPAFAKLNTLTTTSTIKV